MALTAAAEAPPTPDDAEAARRATREQQAQEAFEQARELMRTGAVASACERFEQSLALDPGLGTQFRLAECYEQLGRLATAWRNYLDVAATARKVGMGEREQFARARAAAIASQVPRLTVRLAPRASRSGSVTLDGARLPPSSLSTPIPLDPGRYVLVWRPPGGPPDRREVELAKGVHTDIAVGGPRAAPHGQRPPAPTGLRPTRAAEQPSLLERYPWTFVAGTTAVGLAGAGAALGVHTLDHYDDLAATCGAQPGGCPDRDRDAVETEAVVTSVLLAAAGAAAGAAVLLVVLGPSDEPAAPPAGEPAVALRLGPGGVVLRVCP